MKVSNFCKVLFLTLGIGVALPSENLYACIWNAGHKFSPIPPCKVDDIPGRRRINQLNANLLAKATAGVEKLIWVKKEIKQWQDAYETAKTFKDDVKALWGEVTANPIPSLVAEFNRTSPLARYVRLEDGTFKFVLNPLDLPQIADSVYNVIRQDIGVAGLVNMPEELERQFLSEADHMVLTTANRYQSLVKRETYVNQMSDSIQAAGNRLAERYTTDQVGDGVSEAQISRMSASLSRLKSSSFELQARGIEARMRALDQAVRESDRKDREIVEFLKRRQ